MDYAQTWKWARPTASPSGATSKAITLEAGLQPDAIVSISAKCRDLCGNILLIILI